MRFIVALLALAAPSVTAKPAMERDFGFCEPNVILDDRPLASSPTLGFEYRTEIAHDAWPTEDQLIDEANAASFKRLTDIRITRPGKYIFLFCIRNAAHRPLTVVQHSRWITDSRLYKSLDKKLHAVKETSSIGLVRALDLEPGLNIFIGVVSQPSQGVFKSGWTITSSWERYLEDRDFTRTIYAIFAGFIGMTGFFAIGLLIIYRKIYLTYYLLYLMAITYFVFMWNGILLESDFMKYGISVGLSGAFILLFLRHLIGKPSRRLELLINFTIALDLLAALWSLLQRQMGFSGLTFLASMMLFVFLCFTRTKDNRIILGILLIGTGSIALAGIMVLLNYYLALNISFADHAVLTGMFIEISSFSIAMLLKIRFSEHKALKENKHAFNEMNKIVYPHQLQLIKSGMILEQTMPIHESRAYVVAFDVVGSSRIKHPRGKEFFRNVFARCYALMSEGYDSKEARSKAYRIKEMGDGFLCSLGYPFQAVSMNAANDAVDLAQGFVRVLAEESTTLQWPTPITCGLGIAVDSITGFYPKSGAMEYDLFGPAIVLATRYESMRKSLFPQRDDCSILIIQEAVYRDLTQEYQRRFTEYDLAQNHMVVRDDVSATRLYYQLIQSLPSEHVA